MADTLTPTITPPASNTPVSNVGAVSSAIAQAVPPNPVGGKRMLNPEISTSEAKTGSEGNTQDREVSLEDFDDISSTTTPKAVKKEDTGGKVPQIKKAEIETPKTEEEGDEQESSEEPKLELDIELDDEKAAKKLAESQVVEKAGKEVRDYSGFKPEHTEYLKKLPNHLFNKAKEEFQKIYQIEAENKELKTKLEQSASGKLPQNYYEHPRAFELSEDFQNLTQAQTYINFEESHWMAQLNRIQRGQAWENLTGYDKNGNPITQTIPAVKVEEGQQPIIDIETAERIRQHISKLGIEKRDTQTQIGVLKARHQETFTKSKAGIDGLTEKFFKPFKDEAALPAVVKADLELAKKAFETEAPAFKDNPLTKLILYSYATMKAQARQIIKLAELANRKADGQAQALKAGPGKAEFQGRGNGASSGDKILSAADFDD